MPPSTPIPGPAILEDSDWSKRHVATSFKQLMRLERHASRADSYLSTSAGFPPTPTSRTYGGHVFAQAAWAAAHTVPYGLHVHSITGYFLLLGDTRFAFEYRVKRVRDGGIYALRQVEVYQDSDAADHGKTPTFIAYVSFKRDERNKHRAGAKGQRREFQHQELRPDHLETEYGKVLSRKQRFEDWPVVQGMDGMWSKEMSVAEWKQRGDAFPGLEMRKVDMSGYNKPAHEGGREDNGESARRWRLLLLYRLVVDKDDATVHHEKGASDRVKGRMTGADDQLNLHACAHLYASDRNSLFLAQRALGFEKLGGQMGSLSHTVNFHGHASDLFMIDEKTERKKEFAQESWVSNSGADRVCHNSRIWDISTGNIIASTCQDGMMRIAVKSERDLIDGDTLLRREAKL